MPKLSWLTWTFSRWSRNTEKFGSAPARHRFGPWNASFVAAARGGTSLSSPPMMARASRQNQASRLSAAMATTLGWVRGFSLRCRALLSSSRAGSPGTSACGRAQPLLLQPPRRRPSLGHLNGGGERPRIPPHNSSSGAFTASLFIPTDGIRQEFNSKLVFLLIRPFCCIPRTPKVGLAIACRMFFVFYSSLN